MSIDFTALAEFAGDDRSSPVGTWRPPVSTDLGAGSVLAFDQSLTATGWVLVSSNGSTCIVAEAGSFGTSEGAHRGHVQTLERAEEAFDKFGPLLDKYVVGRACDVACEMPPVGGGRLMSPESSLTSALALRLAAKIRGLTVPVVAPRTGKKWICGNANAKKKEAHDGLRKHCFPWIVGSERVTNEGQRDALIVALVYLKGKAVS